LATVLALLRQGNELGTRGPMVGAVFVSVNIRQDTIVAVPGCRLLGRKSGRNNLSLSAFHAFETVFVKRNVAFV